MSVTQLLDKYKTSPRLFSLADKLSFAQPQKIRLQNLFGSSSQFIAAGIFLHPSCSQMNHVFICNDAEEAAYPFASAKKRESIARSECNGGAH